MPNGKTRKAKSKSKVQTNAGSKEMNLSGFQPVMWPTVFPAKLVYSDFRTLTCSGSQVEYVYRLNSLFDPDFTSVGGQPDGFDELKLMYNRYRVIAVDVEVEVLGQASAGLVAMAPSDTPAVFLNAEGVAGLRNAKSSVFAANAPAKLHARYHIGKLLGYSDDSVLGNPNLDAATSGNPAFQQYLLIAIEGGTGASQSQNVWTKITYYARMEVPIAVLDSSIARRLRFQLACTSSVAADRVEAVQTESQCVDSRGGVGPAATTQTSADAASTVPGPALPSSALRTATAAIDDPTAVQVVKEVVSSPTHVAYCGMSQPQARVPQPRPGPGTAGGRFLAPSR